MIWVYCPRPSDSARELVNKINELGGNAIRIRREDGMHSTRSRGRRRPGLFPTGQRGDLVVNWGCSIRPEVLAGWNGGGVRVMNPQVLHNKYRQLVRLSEAGVPVPPHSHRPDSDNREARWLARLDQHQEANDLLQNLRVGDYYTMFLPSSQDLRVHVMGGHSIRAGRKVPRAGVTQHPEFRSWNAGWSLVYDGEGIRQKYRDAARRAVEALGLDFGAVDILVLGERPAYAPRGLYGREGGFVVLEVNTAPGLEGRTTEVYARKFIEASGNCRRDNETRHGAMG